MGVYEELGLKRVINADATLTRLGGSLMPRPVLTAMMEAASSFVDIEQLQRRVGEEIAAMTGNEAAFVTSGASAGIVLSAAACLAGTDPDKRARLPESDGMRNEVIVFRCGHVEHEFAIRQAGGKLVPIGDASGATLEELDDALRDRTAAVFVAPKGDGPPGLPPLDELIALAHARGVPVIVDAAAQLPPPENLWRFTRDLGADLAIFSGGKGLCGPQSSGVVLGRHDLIEACAFHACPRPFIGRPMKVGKEELAGLYAAVKWYLTLDHDALVASYEDIVAHVISELSRAKGVTVTRDFPSEAGQPMPRAKIVLDEATLGLTRDDVLAALRAENPAIELGAGGPGVLYVNPQTLRPGEERVVTSRLLRILLTRELIALRRSQDEPDPRTEL